MVRKQRPNAGADYRAHGSERPAQFAAREAGAELARVTTARGGADRETSPKPDERANGGRLAPSPGTRAVALYLEHVLSFCGHRPGGHLLRSPTLEYAFDWFGFQGQANPVAGVQLCEGLPVVPVLSVSCAREQTDGRQRQSHIPTSLPDHPIMSYGVV